MGLGKGLVEMCFLRIDALSLRGLEFRVWGLGAWIGFGGVPLEADPGV